MKANTLSELNSVQKRLDALFEQVPTPKDARDPKKYTPDALNSLSAYLLRMLGPELCALSEEAIHVRRQQKVLRSLWYETIKSRQLAIKEAHLNTFRWALSESCDFTRWLQSGQGIYWVRGKAGSGKSTFMRFLSGNVLSRKHLAKWADGQELVIATHYFWYAGLPLQKSQIGLLRSLLYWIFKQCPDLIKSTCPIKYAADATHLDDSWTEADLLQVFELLSRETAVSAKFCFFIDGLDEYTGGEEKYNGSYTELISVLKMLSESPNIKLCVSSRPWTPFEVAFGEVDAQLRLESLTKGDIERYVRSRFASSSKFQVLRSHNEPDNLPESIINDIVTRASGVFLWVSLVVDSLLNGLLWADNLRDLQARLDDLPDDLDEFYKRILDMIEPIYLNESIKIFQTSMDADQALPALAYEFLLQEKSMPDYALRYANNGKMGWSHARKWTPKNMGTRLNARCKDLLEVVEIPDETSFMRYQVDFHHRTVRDFLKGTTVISDIMRKRNMAESDTLVSLCKMMLALIKTMCFEGVSRLNINHFFSLTDRLMYYCRRIETQCTGKRQYDEDVSSHSRITEMCKILDELDHTGIEYLDSGASHWTNIRDSPKGLFQEYQQNSFLGATIQARLSIYLKRQLDEDPTRLRKRGRPLLDYALRPTIVVPNEIPDIDIEVGPVRPVIELLIQRGADPNQAIYIYDSQTPWALFLRTCYNHAAQGRQRGESSSPEVLNSATLRLASADSYSIMCLLLESGADPDVSFQDSTGDVVGIAQTMAVCGFTPGETEEVDRLVSAYREQRLQRRSQRMGWISFISSVFRQ